MAITSAGDIAGIIAASATVAGTIAGVEKVYDKVGEIPPTDGANDLPAILQSITGVDLPQGRITTLNGHEQVDHYWYLDLLIGRSGDIHAEQEAAMPFIPLVLAAYRSNFNLGHRLIVDRCYPQTFRTITLSFGDQAFFAIRFLMHCKTNWTVDYTDPS